MKFRFGFDITLSGGQYESAPKLNLVPLVAGIQCLWLVH
jgi:hypothetical protein